MSKYLRQEFQKIKSTSALFWIVLFYTFCVYGPMASMSIGAGFVMVFWLWSAFSNKKKSEAFQNIKSSPIFFPSVALCLASVWSLVWAKLTHLEFYGVHPDINFLFDIKKVWHIIFPFILASCFSRFSNLELRQLTKIWIWIGLVSAILGIVQHYIPLYHPLILPHSNWRDPSVEKQWYYFLKGGYHATGMTGWHLSYATIIGFPAAVWLASAAVVYRREGFTKKFYAVLFGVSLFFIANILTFSKIAWAAMPATVLLIAIIGFKGKVRYSLVTIVLLLCVFWTTTDEFKLRVAGIGTIQERFEVWAANIDMIKQFPLFGVGWHQNSKLTEIYYMMKGKTGFTSHAHNNFIDLWATTGIIGLICFLWWSWVLFRMSYQIYMQNHALLWRCLGLGFIGGWFCLHFNGLTQCNFWDAKVMHQVGWVMAMTIELYRRRS